MSLITVDFNEFKDNLVDSWINGWPHCLLLTIC